MNNKGYNPAHRDIQMSHISHALWPAQAQRIVITGRLAQRRRSWSVQEITEMYWRRLMKKIPRVSLLLVLGIIFVLSVGITSSVLLFFSREHSTLIVFTVLGVVTGFLLHLLWSNRSLHLRTTRVAASGISSKRGSGVTKAPETPLPVAPLVRVLETIDLSAE